MTMKIYEMLSEQETLKLFEWMSTHRAVCPYFNTNDGTPAIGAIGGVYTYSFTPTNLGMVTKVKCGCGAEIDLTDYDEW